MAAEATTAKKGGSSSGRKQSSSKRGSTGTGRKAGTGAAAKKRGTSARGNGTSQAQREQVQAQVMADTAVPMKVPASQVLVGDQVGTKKAGPFTRVASMHAGERAVRLVGAGDQTIGRPRLTTEVWVLRTPTQPVDGTPAVTPDVLQQLADHRAARAADPKLPVDVQLVAAAQQAKPDLAVLGSEQDALAKARTSASSGSTSRSTRKRDPRLSEVAAHANTLADAKGNRLGDRVQPGNIAKAEQQLRKLVDGDDGAAVLAHFHSSRAKLVAYAGTGNGQELTKQCTEARRAFGKLDPANFNGRRGAAIIVAVADERDGKVKHPDA